MAQRNRVETGPIHRLDPSDPRHSDHPSHDDQWLEFAKEIGWLMAAEADMLIFKPRGGKNENRKLQPRRKRRRTAAA